MLLTMRVRAMTADDWPAVERIFREGIDGGDATFETQTPTWEHFDAARLASPRLVAADTSAGEDSVLGWVAASPVSTRDAYRGVIEHSVYVAANARGRGVGRALLDAFLTAADAREIWTIQSSIFPENVASLRLHERAGFRVVGRRERIAMSRVGAHAGTWRDTILVERRRAG